MVMLHPIGSENIKNAMSHAEELFEKIKPIIDKKAKGGKLSYDELTFASDKIAQIHYIMTNSTPFVRGSAGIAGILTRSLNNAIGITLPATKKNVALDLEAFCRTSDDYRQNWLDFFELPVIY